MDITVLTKKSKLLRLIIFAVISGTFVPVVQAAEIELGIRVGVSHTDNVFLDPSPNEIEDIVYRASPWIDFSHMSPTLDAALRYRFDWYSYDEIDARQSFHMGAGSVTGKLFEEALALEIGASRGQVLGDQDEVIPPGPTSVNR